MGDRLVQPIACPPVPPRGRPAVGFGCLGWLVIGFTYNLGAVHFIAALVLMVGVSPPSWWL